MPSLRQELIRKDRLLNLYMGDKIVNKMPKFMREDFYEKKCKDIMSFEDISIGKKIVRFWDPYPCLPARRWYNKVAS